MKKELPKRIEQPIYSENPSVTTGIGDVTRTVRRPSGEVRHTMMFDREGARTHDGTAVFVEDRALDGEQFVKMYFAGFRATMGLSKTAMSVFELVFPQVQQNDDRVFLAPAASGLSVSVFSRGLRELIDRGFLFRSPYPSVYWMNIRYIFNGNRLEFIQSYRRETRPRRADPAQPDMFAAPAPKNA